MACPEGQGPSDGGASRFFTQAEPDDPLANEPPFFYCAKASTRERTAGCEHIETRHPTVKPVSLMRWLVRLVTPPNGVVLDPFMGSGTTGVAAQLEGFRFVGIEQDADYMEVAKARIAWWEANPQAAEKPKAAKREPKAKRDKLVPSTKPVTEDLQLFE